MLPNLPNTSSKLSAELTAAFSFDQNLTRQHSGPTQGPRGQNKDFKPQNIRLKKALKYFKLFINI